jgi:hypothetical protein
MHSAAVNSGRLREEMTPIIESKELGLSNLQKSYLRSRWLEQMLLMNSKYKRAMRSYYGLRLATVMGCLFILLLVSLNVVAQDGNWGRGLAISFSFLVAASIVVEHLFNLGESYRRYERVAERLKAEGWRFLQLSGPYQSYKNHTEAFAVFANQVEALNQMDVEVYNFDVVAERKGAPVSEEEHPKKLFPLENIDLTESPAVIHGGVVSQHSSHRHAQ